MCLCVKHTMKNFNTVHPSVICTRLSKMCARAELERVLDPIPA
uniref:Uncharacterized protein n=1 Tax=Anguilla anguilla TaxID=7936 RepID=A0A0E9PEG8_ANGAN